MGLRAVAPWWTDEWKFNDRRGACLLCAGPEDHEAVLVVECACEQLNLCVRAVLHRFQRLEVAFLLSLQREPSLLCSEISGESAEEVKLCTLRCVQASKSLLHLLKLGLQCVGRRLLDGIEEALQSLPSTGRIRSSAWGSVHELRVGTMALRARVSGWGIVSSLLSSPVSCEGGVELVSTCNPV